MSDEQSRLGKLNLLTHEELSMGLAKRVLSGEFKEGDTEALTHLASYHADMSIYYQRIAVEAAAKEAGVDINNIVIKS